MNKELIIRSNSDNVDFALLKDGKLIEFQKDEDNSKFFCRRCVFSQSQKICSGVLTLHL